MASFSCIHQAIARLQAVSASHLHLEPICIGPFRLPFDRKLQAFAHFKKPELSIHSAVRSGFLVFATASQDTATPTLVLQEVDFVWKGEGAHVLLTGDFLGWDTKVSLVKGTDRAFHCKQKLSPGTYKYKYIVDGKWAHSPDSPMIEDGQGSYNNQITITGLDGPPAAASTPLKESLPKETAGVKDMAEALPKAGVSTKAAEADTIAPAPKAVAPPKAAPAASTKAAEADALTAAKAAAPPKAAPAASTKAAEADTITAAKAAASPKAAAAASTNAAEADTTIAAAPKAADPPKAAPAAKPAKKVEKPYPQVITEDVIPRVKSHLQKEEGVSDINLVFEDNQLEGSFLKSGIVYTFWAFFTDGKLEGARGFSVSSHGSTPSTVEPFLIDEKRITADLLVFWILKRLAAQSIISSKRV
ncbi:hypothetical protein L7F22_051785 [Adiantum nelumboides]|nr:hypothetical protein [Adiantum nelumboides]